MGRSSPPSRPFWCASCGASAGSLAPGCYLSHERARAARDGSVGRDASIADGGTRDDARPPDPIDAARPIDATVCGLAPVDVLSGKVDAPNAPIPHWREYNTTSRRTSLVIDPPNGRLPPRTPTARPVPVQR